MLSSDTQTIAKVVNGKSNSNKKIVFSGICTDTRSEVNGKLFIEIGRASCRERV